MIQHREGYELIWKAIADKLILELHNQGLSDFEIAADILGVTVDYARQWRIPVVRAVRGVIKSHAETASQ